MFWTIIEKYANSYKSLVIILGIKSLEILENFWEYCKTFKKTSKKIYGKKKSKEYKKAV